MRDAEQINILYMNTGLDLKKQEEIQNLPEKHLMGAIDNWIVINESGDWTKEWLEIAPETQFGARVETMGCTGYGTANILEMIWLKQYGLKINLSDRFINKVSGTTRSGNTVDAPIDAIREYGFLYEHEYPWDRETFEWDDYYAEIPKHLMDLAKTRSKYSPTREWDFEHQYVRNFSDIPKAATTSPLGTTVYGFIKDENGLYIDGDRNPNHWTVGVIQWLKDYTKCGDSYPDDFNCGDNPQQIEFIKKLRKDFKFGCIKRYKIIDRRTSQKKSLVEQLKNMFQKIKRDVHGGLWFIKPAEDKKTGVKFTGKQKIDDYLDLAGAIIDEVGAEEISDNELSKCLEFKFFGK